jgi:hypothetical protein
MKLKKCLNLAWNRNQSVQHVPIPTELLRFFAFPVLTANFSLQNSAFIPFHSTTFCISVLGQLGFFDKHALRPYACSWFHTAGGGLCYIQAESKTRAVCHLLRILSVQFTLVDNVASNCLIYIYIYI